MTSLYEWFEGEVAKGETEIGHSRYAACAGIVQNLGILVGLGVETADLEAFLDRTMADFVRMRAMIRPDRSVGENFEALLGGAVALRTEKSS